MGKANSTPNVDKNLPSCAFTKGAGKSGGKRDTVLLGGEKGSQRAVSARRNANIGTVK